MSVKTERIVMIRSRSPLSKHSLNQTRIYNAIRMEKKAFGGDRKAEKSRRRKQERIDTEKQSLGQVPKAQTDIPLEPMADRLESEGLIFTRSGSDESS